MEAIMPQCKAAFLAPLSVRRYLYLSTLLGVFSGALSINAGSTISFFYLVMLTNLLCIWAFIGPLVLPRWLAWFMLYLTASGAVGICRGTDTVFLAAKQLAAIGLSAVYFANFFNVEGNKIDRAWSTYCRIVYWSSLVALALWPVQCAIHGGFVRLQGTATEPAAFCLLALPAWYWYAYLWITSGRHRKEAIWIALAIACSVSSLGYIGIATGLFLLFTSRMSAKSLIAPIVIFGLMAGIYSASEEIRMRVDDTVASLVNDDVSDANISTYALVTNLFVTGSVLETHPFLGNGLGSHVLSNEKYIGDVPGVESVVSNGGIAGANTHEAASLTLRSLSELGLMGFLGILWFIWHFHAGRKEDRAAISNAIFLVFFEKLLRGGGYANPEQFLFITFYMLNFKQYRNERGVVAPPAAAMIG